MSEEEVLEALRIKCGISLNLIKEYKELEQEINRSINEDLDDDTEILFWQKALKRSSPKSSRLNNPA